MDEGYRYVRCGCKSVWRYRGRIIKKGRCPRCGEWLWKGEQVNREIWEKSLEFEPKRIEGWLKRRREGE